MNYTYYYKKYKSQKTTIERILVFVSVSLLIFLLIFNILHLGLIFTELISYILIIIFRMIFGPIIEIKDSKNKNQMTNANLLYPVKSEQLINSNNINANHESTALNALEEFIHSAKIIDYDEFKRNTDLLKNNYNKELDISVNMPTEQLQDKNKDIEELDINLDTSVTMNNFVDISDLDSNKIENSLNLLNNRKEDITEKESNVQKDALIKPVSTNDTVQNIDNMPKELFFICLECCQNLSYKLKKVNDKILAIHDNGSTTIEKSQFYYTCILDHTFKNNIHYVILVFNLQFQILSQEVSIKKIVTKETIFGNNSKTKDMDDYNIKKISYLCYLCKKSYSINEQSEKIKNELAGGRQIISIQVMHQSSEDNTFHQAILRIDLKEKMLVAEPDIILIDNKL